MPGHCDNEQEFLPCKVEIVFTIFAFTESKQVVDNVADESLLHTKTLEKRVNSCRNGIKQVV